MGVTDRCGSCGEVVRLQARNPVDGTFLTDPYDRGYWSEETGETVRDMDAAVKSLSAFHDGQEAAELDRAFIARKADDWAHPTDCPTGYYVGPVSDETGVELWRRRDGFWEWFDYDLEEWVEDEPKTRLHKIPEAEVGP